MAGLEHALPASHYLSAGRLLTDLALHGGTEEDLSDFDPAHPALSAATPEPNYLV